MSKNSICLKVGVLVGMFMPALALSSVQQQLPTMTVTANKIAQPQEEVPASLSVMHGDDLRDAGVNDLQTLARRTPNFVFQPFGQSGTNVPVVRGLTSSATAFSSSMLMLVDGVPTLMGQGFDHNLLGVERVEILRGPQSTLYGRNAEAGVMSIHTRQPGDEPYALLDTTLGSRNKRSLRFDLSQALVADTLYGGLAGEWLEQDGFIDNTYRGGKEDARERHNGRAVLRWTPAAATSATLRYSRQDYRDGGSQWGPATSSHREVRSGTSSWNHSSGRSLSLDVTHELESGLQLRSITARNDFYDRVRQDTDFLPLDRLHVERDYHLNTLSQELRLEGEWADSHWLLGLYAERSDHSLDFRQKLPLALTRTEVDLTGNSNALFGQWTQPLAERWTLTLGARIERDKVSLSPGNAGKRSDQWQRFTPKLALNYALTDDTQVYASYAEGYRAGGFNAFAASADYPGYDPEQVDAYEFGIKGWAAQQRLQYSAAVYWMAISDMQVQQIVQPGVVYISNAAKARASGLELEANYLLSEHWRVQTSLGVNRTRFRQFQNGNARYQGNHAPFAPDLTGYLGLSYDTASGWFAEAGLSAVGRTYLDSANRYSRTGHALLDLNAGYRFDQIGVSAYVDNATDKRYDAVGFLNGMARAYSAPREIGLRLSYLL
ncbi:TonB-dependent receptor [Pseudomonas sp.]|uniref:TonB-dependent receptor n=1 Tax=Pseudomonas sp. TaxID=306 RepID=UPI003A96A090